MFWELNIFIEMQTATIDKSKHWTAEDYLQLEEGLLAQLINGQLIVSPAPTPNHQRVIRNLYDALKALNPNGEVLFSPLDLYIDNTNVLQPDICYISQSSKHIISKRGLEGPPELVVEVLSPSNSFIDRNAKKRKYLEFGVQEYWIVDPDNKTLEIYTNSLETPSLYLSEQGEITSIVLDSLSFDLSLLFSGLE